MIASTRESMCKTCPWREENQDQLEIQNIRKMVDCGAISPCHDELEKVTGSPYTGVEKYAAKVEVFKVCRGFVASTANNMFGPIGPVWDNLIISYIDSDKSNDPPVADIMEVLRGNIGH